MPRFTITDRQRAPIYEQLRRHIASIDDVRVLADADPEEAGRMAFQHSDAVSGGMYPARVLHGFQPISARAHIQNP